MMPMVIQNQETNGTNNYIPCLHYLQLMFQKLFIKTFKGGFTCLNETCLQVPKALFNNLCRKVAKTKLKDKSCLLVSIKTCKARRILR